MSRPALGGRPDGAGTARSWILVWSLAVTALCAGAGHATPLKVVMIGDSITLGVVSDPKGPAYADLVDEALGPAFDVVNVGCGATSSVHWTPFPGPFVVCFGRAPGRERLFETYVAPHTPADFATVLLGTNDASIGTPASQYRENLTVLIQGLFQWGVDTVIAMPPPPHANPHPAVQALVAQYHGVVLDLCSRIEGVVCGPDLFTLLELERDFAPLNVHPNASGHAKIAGALVGTILGVPEPGTLALLLAGLTGLGAARRFAPSCANGAKRPRRSGPGASAR